MIDRNIPRITAIGMLSWDSLLMAETYPSEGGWTTIHTEHSLPGGTTGNSAATAAILGAHVKMFGAVGADAFGDQLRDSLRNQRVDTTNITIDPKSPTDRTTVIVSSESADRTIFWHRGAHLTLGFPIDIVKLFAADVCLIDTDDFKLTRFLVDLPAHTSPTIRLAGTLVYLADADRSAARETMLRFDTVIGSLHQLCWLLNLSATDRSVAELQRRMTGSNLRSAYLTDGANGAVGIDREQIIGVAALPVEAVDATGAGDAFAGAVAYGLALRWDLKTTLTFANAVAGISTTRIGSQSALPTLADVNQLLAAEPR